MPITETKKQRSKQEYKLKYHNTSKKNQTNQKKKTSTFLKTRLQFSKTTNLRIRNQQHFFKIWQMAFKTKTYFWGKM